MEAAAESVQFCLQVGRLLKGQVIREVRKGAFMSGLTCDVQEDRGMFESMLYFDVRGPGATEYYRNVQRWAEKISR